MSSLHYDFTIYSFLITIFYLFYVGFTHITSWLIPWGRIHPRLQRFAPSVFGSYVGCVPPGEWAHHKERRCGKGCQISINFLVWLVTCHNPNQKESQVERWNPTISVVVGNWEHPWSWTIFDMVHLFNRDFWKRRCWTWELSFSSSIKFYFPDAYVGVWCMDTYMQTTKSTQFSREIKSPTEHLGLGGCRIWQLCFLLRLLR